MGKMVVGIFFRFRFCFFFIFLGRIASWDVAKRGVRRMGGKGPHSLHFFLHIGEMESPHMGKRVLGMFLFLFFVLFVLFFNLFGAN